MMQTRSPKTIKREANQGLIIEWLDGTKETISCNILRQNCPCAGCREAGGDKSHSSPLTAAPAKSLRLNIVTNTAEEALTLKEAQPVGNYAIRLIWGDGHNDGIYSYELLNSLSSQK
jgi:DUF971 family protein